MLTEVDVITSQGAMISLPLEDETSGLIVRGIEGLDPVKATLVSSSFANMDGAQYHSSRREPRNIKLTIGLEPDYVIDSVSDLRNRLYAFFMPKAQNTLRFKMDDGTPFDIIGRVETFESALFSKDPVVDVSVMCFDPDFYNPAPVTVAGASTAGLTELPIPYKGTVETGFLLELAVNRDLGAFTVYHKAPDGTLHTMDFADVLAAGDILRINTVVGNKYIRRVRAGVETSLLYGLSPQSPWLELQPGTNYIRVYAVGAAIPYTISYTNKFGGL